MTFGELAWKALCLLPLALLVLAIVLFGKGGRKEAEWWRDQRRREPW